MRVPTRLAPLLLLLAIAPAGGCGVFAGASPTPTPTSTPTPTPTSTPTPTPTPVPRLETETLEIAQGGAAVVRVSGVAASGTVTFEGRESPLIDRPGGFWAVIGVGADHPSGTYDAEIALVDGAGHTFAQMTAAVVIYGLVYPVEQIYLEPDASALLDSDLAAQEAARRAAVFSAVTPERLWEGLFIYPASGPISSPYGIGRSYNSGPVTSFHHGTDFQNDEGAPVVAANSGRVALAEELPIRGLSVIIDHGAGVFTGYHHLAGITVEVGEGVTKGDLVGFVGMTGLATGPHLHWELIVVGVEVDPVLWTLEEYGP
jgi:hypothetical protein